jgi:hypothetical protein
MMRRRALILVLALLGALLVAGVLAPAASANRLDVPVWKQSDSRWGSLHLGSSSYTMSGSGCAVTSCAMVVSYFGSSKDPRGLCKALSAGGGFTSGGAIYWQNVPAAAGGTVSYVGRWNSCSLTRINQELDGGYPVIVQVSLKGSTHFVVLTGRSGSTYYLNDPAYGDTTTLNSRYGTPSTAIKGFRVYHGTHAVAPAPGPTPTRYQQTDSHLVYAGTWATFSTNGASGGSYGRANTNGASVTVNFTGTYLSWIATAGTTLSKAYVSLDGGMAVSLDLARAAVAYQQKVWNTGTLASGNHSVKIWWDPADAAGKYISVDAFDVLGTLN